MFKNLILETDLVLASKYQNYQSIFYRLIYCDDKICWGLQIDIFHKGFYYKGKNIIQKNIEKYIIKHNNINVLSIDKANYIGFLKEILHNGVTAKEKYTKGFLSLVQSNKEYYKKELISLYGDALGYNRKK